MVEAYDGSYRDHIQQQRELCTGLRNRRIGGRRRSSTDHV